MKPRRAPRIEVVVESAPWTRNLPRAASLCRKVAAAALEGGLSKSGLRKSVTKAPSVEMSIILSSDAAIRRLNAEWRGKDKPTNVLSFPAAETTPGAPLLLGDVVVAYGTTSREAKAESKSLPQHLTHLVVHGVLHLLGYDHERDTDAETMERLEIKILSRLGISNPYAEPAAPLAAKRKARS
jgi:probable rRNA maturation factor